MTLSQSLTFLMIASLVTARTLILKASAERIAPHETAWAIGSGTLFCTVILWPVTFSIGLSDVGQASNWLGGLAGLVKGTLLTALLVAQQRLIVHSLSAATYVFPVAMSMIGALDLLVFQASGTVGAMVAIVTLATSGLAFAFFGPLRSMHHDGKRMFVIMVVAVVGFACCDRLGIPSVGWYSYLVYTALGNTLSALILARRIPRLPLRPWVSLAVVWSVPELYFNYAISGVLPVSYGYLAISLRVPILMVIALVYFKEGRPTSQIAFGLIALFGSIPVFF